VYVVGDDQPSTQREYAEWLGARLGVPLPPSVPSLAPGAPRRAVRNRRICNARLKRDLDYRFLYPTYVEGEMAIERELQAPGTSAVPSPASAAPVERAPSSPTAPREPAPPEPVSSAPAPVLLEPVAGTASVGSTVAATASVGSRGTANPFDVPYGAGTSEYERYLKTAELLGLQKPAHTRNHPDELFFQTLHQVEELWMKLMIHELGEMVVHTDADRWPAARESLRRAAELGGLLHRQLELFEHMLPSAYLVIRKGLGQGSGMDSPGFVRLNQIVPSVWAAFERALARHTIDLMELYAKPGTHPALLAVAEGLVDIDAAMQRFKREHIMVVRRIIGIGTASLRGNPMDMLEKSAQLTWFPSLWAVRDGMFIDFKAGQLEV
jgi:tryptophan 2,3-dioxygenase